MARIHDYNASGKTIAASGTTVFTASDIPSTGVVLLHFVTTGANNSLANVSRIRVKASGQTIWDLTPDYLAAYIQAMTDGRIRLPRGTVLDTLGAAGTAAAIRRWTLPLCDLRQPTIDMSDTCQFPRGANITVEHQFGASASAGSLFCGWTITNLPGEKYPRVIGNQMAIAASSSNSRYNITDDGEVFGLGLNSLGMSRVRLVLGSQQVLASAGQDAASATFLGAQMLCEMDQLYNGSTDMAAGTAGVPVTFYDPFVKQIDAHLAAPQGSSYVELGTNANWAGVANEVLLCTMVPQ